MKSDKKPYDVKDVTEIIDKFGWEVKLMNSNEARLYVFIIWEKSRGQTQNILDDLKKKFVIREIFEVEWNKKNFLNNL